MVKNQNFGQQWKFRLKIKFWSKIENICKQSISWPKIEIWVRNQKSKFRAKIEILLKHRKYLSKIENVVKTQNLDQKSKFWATNKTFGLTIHQIPKLCQKSKSWQKKSKIWSKTENFCKNRNFLWNLRFDQKQKISVKIETFCEI